MIKTLGKFPATFHVANVMEIFERMAWYGFYALASLYITEPLEAGGLGLSDEQRGVITGVVPFLLYLFPVVTGAFADKFGYKRTFLLAFSILTPGYFLLGQVRGFWPFLLVFLFVAVGAALFKPVVTGTIARVTTEETKALGFGIFYMVVNVGGFVGPLVASVMRREGWNRIFVMSSVWIGLNFIPLLLFYREPRTAPEGSGAAGAETIGERLRRVWVDVNQVLGNTRFFLFVAAILVLLLLAGGGWMEWRSFLVWTSGWVAANMALDVLLRWRRRVARNHAEESSTIEGFWSPMRLGDWRFGVYLLILSGFWTEFNQIFLTMPLYIRDYTDTSAITEGVRSVLAAAPVAGDFLAETWTHAIEALSDKGKIKPENLVNLDALAIVLGQVFISAAFARWPPFRTMIAGTLITGISMLLGIWSDMGWICVFSILAFSVGEMMASPKSQEYVARVAPPRKEAMYMGYYFVTIALGNLFGGLLSGQAYAYFANPRTGIGRPDLMWMLFTGIAVATAAILYLFNRYCAPGRMGSRPPGTS